MGIKYIKSSFMDDEKELMSSILKEMQKQLVFTIDKQEYDGYYRFYITFPNGVKLIAQIVDKVKLRLVRIPLRMESMDFNSSRDVKVDIMMTLYLLDGKVTPDVINKSNYTKLKNLVRDLEGYVKGDQALYDEYLKRKTIKNELKAKIQKITGKQLFNERCEESFYLYEPYMHGQISNDKIHRLEIHDVTAEQFEKIYAIVKQK